MNLIKAFNALWDIATIEERKEWDECGDGSDTIKRMEKQIDELRAETNALNEHLSVAHCCNCRSRKTPTGTSQ